MVFSTQNKTLKRVVTIFAISGVGLTFSFFVLKPDNEQTRKNAKESIAYVSTKTNEVRKQINGEVIWNPVQKGDLLFLGDKIKTAKQGTAQIQFNDGKAKIDVEEDSVVVISKLDNKLSLKIMKGSLFVNNSSKENKVSVVTEQNGKEKQVDLTDATAQISVNKEGKSNIELISGSMSNGENETLIQLFQGMTPFYGETIYVDYSNGRPFTLGWQKLPATYKVTVEVGESRDSLVLAKETRFNVDQTEATLTGLTGQHYWRLVAEKIGSGKKTVSPTFKVNLLPILPPVISKPLNQDLVKLRPENLARDFEFRWNLPTLLSEVKITVASDKDMKNILIDQKVPNQTFFNTQLIKTPGKYFWKVEGMILNNNLKVVSDVSEFDLFIGNDVFSPELLIPQHKEKFIRKEGEAFDGISFAWRPEADAKEYKFSISGPKGKKEYTTSASDFQLPDLILGNYQWSVQSITEDNQISKVKETRSFSISKLGVVDIKEYNPITAPEGLKTKYQYIENLPIVSISWVHNTDAIKYRVILANNEFLNGAEGSLTQNSNHSIQTQMEGRYFVLVEGLNEFNQVIGKSSIHSFVIEKSPLPEPPEYSFNTPMKIEADSTGSFFFAFKQIPENSKLQIELRDFKENVITTQTIGTNKGNFADLLPGEYNLYARVIDTYGRIGSWSMKRAVLVRELSSIAPPTIRGINIR